MFKNLWTVLDYVYHLPVSAQRRTYAGRAVLIHNTWTCKHQIQNQIYEPVRLSRLINIKAWRSFDDSFNSCVNDGNAIVRCDCADCSLLLWPGYIQEDRQQPQGEHIEYKMTFDGVELDVAFLVDVYPDNW